MDTEKQRQHRCDEARLTKSGDARSEQLLVMPTVLLLTNGELWLPGELLSGSEGQTPGWILDMNIRLVRVAGIVDACTIKPILASVIKNKTAVMFILYTVIFSSECIPAGVSSINELGDLSVVHY